jgi:hypothetical protein
MRLGRITRVVGGVPVVGGFEDKGRNLRNREDREIY